MIADCHLSALAGCLDDVDLFLRQPVQLVHRLVNRGVYLVHAPLERVTAILFGALGFCIILLQLHAASQRLVRQRDDRRAAPMSLS